MSSFPTCPECGYVHPPEPPGECRVAKDQKQKEELQAKGLGDLYTLAEKVKQDICTRFLKLGKAEIEIKIAKIRNFILNL